MKNEKSKTTILSGFVVQPLNRNRFGIVIVNDFAGTGKERSFGITDQSGPRFANGGASRPEFGCHFKNGCDPLKTDAVILEVSGVNGDMKVVAWGYASDWQEAEKDIAFRPRYRVIGKNFFLGKELKKEINSRPVFEGNLFEMIAESPRDGQLESTVDKFAPVYRNELFTVRNRFEVLATDGTWKPCADPRSFPAIGPMYRLMYQEGRSLRQLAIGRATEINLEFPRGDKDPLAKYISMEATSGGYLYWQRRDNVVMGKLEAVGSVSLLHRPITFARGKYTWCETNDPRPLPAAAAPAKKAEAIATKRSVAMPKRTGKKLLTTVVSLGELSLAPA